MITFGFAASINYKCEMIIEISIVLISGTALSSELMQRKG